MTSAYKKDDDQVEIRISPFADNTESINENLSMSSEDLNLLGEHLSKRDADMSYSTRSLDRSRSGRSRSVSTSSANRDKRDLDTARNDAIPLLPDNEHGLPRQRPPIAGPEIDDDDFENEFPSRFPEDEGIDDGFLDISPKKDSSPAENPNGLIPRRRGSIPANFPYAPEFIPGITNTLNPDPRIIPDVNVYQQKKILAQGMMDLALLSANANQLRYVLETNHNHPYFYCSLVLISTSLILQIAVGMGLILNSRYNVKRDVDILKADRVNNWTVIAIFIITVVNVLISAFGVAEIPQQPIAQIKN